MLYSTLYKSRLDVDDHLFAVCGNGFEWIQGELVEEELSVPLSKIDAMEKCILRSKEIEHIVKLELIGWKLNNNDEDEDSRLVSFAEHMVSDVHKKLKEECEYIKSVDSSYKKYKHVPHIYERGDWKIYPICEYSKLVTFPDDIKPDWAKALYKFVCWCLKHTKYIDYNYGLDEQLDYLREAKERLEKIIYGNI